MDPIGNLWYSTPVALSGSSAITTWVTADRVTGVDIMCISNTHQIDRNNYSKSTSLRASMPYKPTKTFSSLPKGSTHFQRLKLNDSRREQSEVLKNEMVTFFEKLAIERDERKMVEAKSATRIQASFRGFRHRFNLCKCPPHVLPSRTQLQLQDELCNWASLLNLPPIRGLSLENRSQTSKRFAKIRDAAAIRIQRFFQ